MRDHLIQLSIHCYYAGEIEAGLRACERLLRMPLDDAQRTIARDNRTWYTPSIEQLVPCTFHALNVEPAQPGWSRFNPSIVALADGWCVNVRSSNYRIVDGQYAMHPAGETCIRTRNHWVRLSDDLQPIEGCMLRVDYPRTDFPVDGFEDVRVNLVDGEVRVSACVRNHAPFDGTCRIGTARIVGSELVDVEVLPTRDGAHEKNWMPLLGREEWLYASSFRGRVSCASRVDGKWTVVGRAEAPILATGFRGGSQLIPIDASCWLALVHEVAHPGGGRVYEHRFVVYDEAQAFAITGVSPPFYFRRARGIEFAAGLARRGDRLVASFGVDDAEAWLVETSLEAVLATLVPAA